MANKNSLSRDNIHLLFDKISPTYDLTNKVLSFGIDSYWRNALNAFIPKKLSLKILDLATGTGDQAFSTLRKRKNVSITGIDLAEQMLAIAKNKAKKRNLSDKVAFETASATTIPFQPLSFDFITMSFGIRNVTSVETCFQEMFRVLKPGGTVLILEFSLPQNTLFKSLYLFYLRYILPKIGALISGSKQAYSYLNKTIETFPFGKNFCDLLKSQGFQQVSFKPLSFGIVNLYIASKDL